jgi:hypothetical protein
MAASESNVDVERHLREFFGGHRAEEHQWVLGRAKAELPRLRVLEFAPGPRTGLWVYATVGGWEARADPRLEFLIVAPGPDMRHVELLTMAAWYHGRTALGVGHTLPIGEPWVPGSTCDCFLVSLPYPFGPDLEVCNLPDGHLHVLWLLPITPAERAFKVQHGPELLEGRFDEAALEYWNPDRVSVI